MDRVRKEEWIGSMTEELVSIDKNQTWDLLELHEWKKAICCKWAYKKKGMSGNEQVKFKSRLVAKNTRKGKI